MSLPRGLYYMPCITPMCIRIIITFNVLCRGI
nr:MAG TPA: hypothetical protein [Caudoviricetes sp.]